MLYLSKAKAKYYFTNANIYFKELNIMAIWTVFPKENGQASETELPQDFDTFSEAEDFAKTNYDEYEIESC